jgi:GR25 family glycosyltransferase involved in LPS biosynthesis
MIPAYVINLEERKDRWNHIQEKFKLLSLNIQRIPAIKGKNIIHSVPITPFVKGCLQNNICSKYHIESFGALGCALSHIEAWKKVQTISAIFEDDAMPIEFTSFQLKEAYSWLQNNQFDMVLLGSHKQPFVKNQELIPWIDSGIVTTGAWAYLVTPFAAKKLLEKTFPLDLSIDLYIQTVNLRIGYLPCFKQRFFLQGPDIEHLQEKIYSKNDIYKCIYITAIISLALYYVLHTSSKVFWP